MHLAPVATQVLGASNRPRADVGRQEPVDDVIAHRRSDTVGVAAAARVVVALDQREELHRAGHV